MASIIEKGEELIVNDLQLAYLLEMGMIYDGLDGYFHPVDMDMDDIENQLLAVGLMG